MLGQCCETDSAGRRGQHCLKPITHWLMILSSHLATPFSHSLLLLTLHKSNVGSSTVHGPQVVRKALPRPRGSVWLRLSVCMFFPKLLSRCRFLHNFIAAVLFFVSPPVCLVSVSRVCVREVFFEPGGRFIASVLLLWCKSWKVSVCSCH